MSAHLPFLCARRLGPAVLADRFRRILERESVILSVVSSLAALVTFLTAGVSPGLPLGLPTAVTRSVSVPLRRSAVLRVVPLTLPSDGVLLAALSTAVVLAPLELTARVLTALVTVLLVPTRSASVPGLVSGTVLFATVRAPWLLSPLRVLGTVCPLVAVVASVLLLVLPAGLLTMLAALLLVLTCLLMVLTSLSLVLTGLPVMPCALLTPGILLVALPGLGLSSPCVRRLLLLRFASLTVRRLPVAVVSVLTVLFAAAFASVLVIHGLMGRSRMTLSGRRGSNGSARSTWRGSGKNDGKRSPAARRYTRLSPSKPAVTDRCSTKPAVTPDRPPPLRV